MCQSQGFRPGAHHQIATDQRIAFPRGNAYCTDIIRLFRQSAVDVYGTTLLCKPGHFHHAGPLTIQLCRLRHDSTDGHNTRAANASDHHIKCAINVGQLRHWQVWKCQFACLFLADLCPLQRHK